MKCANFSHDEPEKGLYPISDLLRQLATLRAKTKLLILDAGREGYDFRSNIAAHSFPRLVERELLKLNDPTLWVLTANSNLERSHVSPALKQSVFGYVLSRGLRGAADEDEDDDLQLDELYQFVRHNVSSWVTQATDRNDTQTPQLLNVAIRSTALAGTKTAFAAATSPQNSEARR